MPKKIEKLCKNCPKMEPKWIENWSKIWLVRERVILRELCSYCGKTTLCEVQRLQNSMKNQPQICAKSMLEEGIPKLCQSDENLFQNGAEMGPKIEENSMRKNWKMIARKSDKSANGGSKNRRRSETWGPKVVCILFLGRARRNVRIPLRLWSLQVLELWFSTPVPPERGRRI